MYEDEFEETLDADEADTLRGGWRGGGSRAKWFRRRKSPPRRYRPPGRGGVWQRPITHVYKGPVGPKPKCPEGQVVAAHPAPGGGRPVWKCVPRPSHRVPGGRRMGGPPKCPPGTTARYDRGWKCKPDIVSTMPVIIPQIDPRLLKKLEWLVRRTCGTRSMGRGITWGNISPEVQRIPIAQRRALVDKVCGKKPPMKPPQDINLQTLKTLKRKLGVVNEKISKATTQVGKLERERDAIKRRIEQLATSKQLPIKLWTHG